MKTYRICQFDFRGSLRRSTNIDCASDHEACMIGKQKTTENIVVEVWQGHRLIGEFAAPSRSLNTLYTAQAAPGAGSL